MLSILMFIPERLAKVFEDNHGGQGTWKGLLEVGGMIYGNRA